MSEATSTKSHLRSASLTVGDRFTNLVLLEAPRIVAGRKKAVCKCDCGSVRDVRVDALVALRTHSCGCYHRKRMKVVHTRHGDYTSPLYKVWNSMLQRCENPKDKRFYDYGGRGITVCKAWHKYEKFKEWSVDYKPGLSIERKNNDRGYCPSNCKWATRYEQQVNRRKSSRNKSGTEHVMWDKSRRKWRAEIMRAGKRYFLGRFTRKRDAARRVQTFLREIEA